ncbi:GIY-YIG nuclease family protein [Paenibacillus sp. LMG 31459]|uniref:GIY-YIG nuclease family protein n=1 Tax=Paenibacillus phytohabitans TaxID=2654978 RepID=A0ABX1YP76_9BACL|nr:GIY-YIG nuclease family protein [Paenibacillus phytohabitans]NOU81575.1 GIY-YIG nuclease family protein [Paenibacillus phytohabitans]
MSNGYVYVLTNESMKGLVKIGITSISPLERARKLSKHTSVPTPFKVAYEVYIENSKELEKEIHTELDDFRVNSRREFFNYPLNKTIELVQLLSKKDRSNNEDIYESIDILGALKEKYEDFINESVTSVKLYQTKERVSLQVTSEYEIGNDLLDEVIRRTDLGFISDGEYEKSLAFDPKKPIQVNVDSFLMSSPATHVVSHTDLFTEKGAEQLYNEDVHGIQYSNED